MPEGLFLRMQWQTWFIDKGEYGTLKTVLAYGLWITLSRRRQLGLPAGSAREASLGKTHWRTPCRR